MTPARRTALPDYLASKPLFWYNANVSSALTTVDVDREIERLLADTGFGYIHVIVADGRIERIDRCVQTKAPAKPSRSLTVPSDAHDN